MLVRRWRAILFLSFCLTFISTFLSLRLYVDTDLSRLVPAEYKSVQALERLRQVFGGESHVVAVIESPSFVANKAFAEALIPAALSLVDAEGEVYLARVDYHRDMKFMRNNALYFATYEELDSLDSALRVRIEEEKLRRSPLFFELDDVEETDRDYTTMLDAWRSAFDLREYPISPDSLALALKFYPTGSQADIDRSETLYRSLEQVVRQLNVKTYHPEMKVTLSGRMLRQVMEVRAITEGALRSLFWGVLAVIITVMCYFAYHFSSKRIVCAMLAASLIGTPFIMSLTWTFALAYLVYGHINTMSSTLGLVLFGLGIDYGIHFYARYLEESSKSEDSSWAVRQAFSRTGQAISIGALSTAAALFALVMSDFRGFSQFGFIAGSGVFFSLLTMILVLPALIVAVNQLNIVSGELANKRSALRSSLPCVRPVVGVCSILALLALYLSSQLSFEYDFSQFEPVYEEYEKRDSRVQKVFSKSPYRNAAFIIVDERHEVSDVVEVLRARMEADSVSPTIGRIVTLQDRFPTEDEHKRKKLERIEKIRDLIESLPSQYITADLEYIYRAASTIEPLSEDQIPDFFTQPFRMRNGELGRIIAVYPSVGLSDGRNSIAFSEDVARVETPSGNAYWSGSTPLVAADMLQLMLDEIPWLVVGVACTVTLLMRLSFGSMGWAVLALLPLLVGVLWMILIQVALDLKFNLYNVVVLPAILGIGNDAGAHIVHRYRQEGRDSLIRVLRSSGAHVSVGSLTTAMGFSGLIFSEHPGLNSMGELALLGIFCTWTAALVFLPYLIQMLEERGYFEAERSFTPLSGKPL